jgi:hypothetical protein
MPLLEAVQANFIATINKGPDALDPALFAGPIDRVLLGLKAHANTINHARLVALEQTFPLTRRHIGEEGFSQLSRLFVETDAAKACDNNAIGSAFKYFIETQPLAADAQELIQIEWAWLESYHAAEADALTLDEIAGLSQEALLNMAVQWHPATRLIAVTTELSHQLTDLTTQAAILIVRPNSQVQLLSLDQLTVNVALAAEKITSVGNLLALATEQQDMTDPASLLLTLINAGALTVAQR